MTDAAIILPERFAHLQPFVEHWALPGLDARSLARGAATFEDLTAFHDAMVDEVEPMLDLLDRQPLDQLDRAESALLNMALAFVHVALAVEMQTDAEAIHTGWRAAMPITHFPPEAWNGNVSGEDSTGQVQLFPAPGLSASS